MTLRTILLVFEGRETKRDGSIWPRRQMELGSSIIWTQQAFAYVWQEWDQCRIKPCTPVSLRCWETKDQQAYSCVKSVTSGLYCFESIDKKMKAWAVQWGGMFFNFKRWTSSWTVLQGKLQVQVKCKWKLHMYRWHFAWCYGGSKNVCRLGK